MSYKLVLYASNKSEIETDMSQSMILDKHGGYGINGGYPGLQYYIRPENSIGGL